MERVSSQRTLSHVALDTEGVRSGKMEVQMPYFLTRSQLQESVQELVQETFLDTVISSMMK